jgi:hypothetical protein
VGADGVGACWGTHMLETRQGAIGAISQEHLYPSPPEGSHLERQAPGHPQWDGLRVFQEKHVIQCCTRIIYESFAEKALLS